MVCINICERVYSKIIFGKSHYEGDNKRNPVDGMKSVSVMTSNSFHALECTKIFSYLQKKTRTKSKDQHLGLLLQRFTDGP